MQPKIADDFRFHLGQAAVSAAKVIFVEFTNIINLAALSLLKTHHSCIIFLEHSLVITLQKDSFRKLIIHPDHSCSVRQLLDFGCLDVRESKWSWCI